jgi:hypothetical protein
MAKRNKAVIQPRNLTTVPRMESNGFEINYGEVVKVYGEYGARFKFVGVTTNDITGSTWVDCFEIIGGIPSVFRSFKPERIKRIPKRGKRAKRVSVD